MSFADAICCLVGPRRWRKRGGTSASTVSECLVLRRERRCHRRTDRFRQVWRSHLAGTADCFSLVSHCPAYHPLTRRAAGRSLSTVLVQIPGHDITCRGVAHARRRLGRLLALSVLWISRSAEQEFLRFPAPCDLGQEDGLLRRLRDVALLRWIHRSPDLHGDPLSFRVPLQRTAAGDLRRLFLRLGRRLMPHLFR